MIFPWLPPLLVNFVGGDRGAWRVDRLSAVTGRPLPAVDRVDVIEGEAVGDHAGVWVLRGTTSHERYVERPERDALVARQPPLRRSGATRSALIPVSKSPAWWELTQEERRAIIETRSRHIATGLSYLPAIARRLHHGRDLRQEFDFLTWFEFAPADAEAFEELVGRLRESEEWSYVDREIDIRLER
ncbi:MAG: chlorite dismutase family protein [Acidimicrobiales bacterium]